MSIADQLALKLNIRLPSPVQALVPPWHTPKEFSFFIKRDDTIHPIISGNKWRKLAPLLQRVSQNDGVHLISFGGGYSNHLHALAYCCNQLGFRFTAFVRGDYSSNMTPTLNDCARWGTDIRFLSKIDYAKRTDAAYLSSLRRAYPHATIVPEGGSHPDCLAGMQALSDELAQQVGDVEHVFTPVASGGTLAGLAASHSQIGSLTGIAVLKGRDYVESLVQGLLPEGTSKAATVINTAYTICHDFHCGGYAKAPLALQQFCTEQHEALGIPLEPIYSGKTLAAIKHFAEAGHFATDEKVVFLHTGGLQGARETQ